jgi:hypothetical protein
MAKGKIVGIIPKTWNEKKFWEFQIENDDKVFTCWQDAFATKKVGDEIEFETQPDGRGGLRATLAGAGSKGGGYSRGKSPEEIALQKKAFALSYAKDQSGMILDFLKPNIKLPEGMKFADSFEYVQALMTQFTITIAKDYEAFLDKKPSRAETAEKTEKPPWA